jgi:hypothetical protein
MCKVVWGPGEKNPRLPDWAIAYLIGEVFFWGHDGDANEIKRFYILGKYRGRIKQLNLNNVC